MTAQPMGEILVGFGEAVIRVDGEVVYDGEAWARSGYWSNRLFLTFAHAAQIAEAFPGEKTEVAIHGPFWGATWEWVDGEWKKTQEDGGFA